MMNADVTAENRPDCTKPHGKRQVPGGPHPQYTTNTHENERGIQVFVVLLLEVPIVFFHFSLELVVELHSRVDSRPSAAQHRLQGAAKGFLQPFVAR